MPWQVLRLPAWCGWFACPLRVPRRMIYRFASLAAVLALLPPAFPGGRSVGSPVPVLRLRGNRTSGGYGWTPVFAIRTSGHGIPPHTGLSHDRMSQHVGHMIVWRAHGHPSQGRPLSHPPPHLAQRAELPCTVPTRAGVYLPTRVPPLSPYGPSHRATVGVYVPALPRYACHGLPSRAALAWSAGTVRSTLVCEDAQV